MASIAQLSIRGVRSFSPSNNDQFIDFCFPLTVIIGANGSGKTTILESLKYAVTGSLPPCAKPGESFIHDPRLLGQKNVEATIELSFNNAEGSSMVATRTMKLTKNLIGASFKAFAGTLRTVNATTTHTNAELDKRIPFFLGMTYPILEHVAFCRQEDSCWPFQEEAVLKKRLNDIFNSTPHAKALEVIKTEKNNISLSEDLNAGLEGLNSHKQAATGGREESEECNSDQLGIVKEIDVPNTQAIAVNSGAQVIKSVIRAVIRFDGVAIDHHRINEDCHPSELLRYLEERVQYCSGLEEKPESITKLLKRLKKMSRKSMSCPCCDRPFTTEDDVVKFQTKMSELADPSLSELHAMASKMTQEAPAAREKYEHWHKIVSANMGEYIESSRVNAKLVRAKERVQSLTDQNRNVRRKLNEPEHKSVDERQNTSMIVHGTSGSYDHYHEMKINHLNKSTREIWTHTYNGEDITNIEIKRKVDVSDEKYSYNYRVVVSRGETQLDMSYCSAGERVLVSIVIRLALAKTFCLNYGVMVLDEPTTNLDIENKRALAIVLSKIITSRAAQSKFQLVILTCDEGFVSVMKQELSSHPGFSMPEYYYRVSRDKIDGGRFYSKICTVDWDDLDDFDDL